jgi:hypothetical protein
MQVASSLRPHENGSMTERKDLRVAERLSVNSAISCDFASPVLEDFPAPRIKNVSTDGIGLISNERLDVGLMVVINLVDPTKKLSKTVRVRIVHCTPQAGGTFLVGGTFVTPLTYEEFRNLVM